MRILLASADQPHGRAPGLSLASFLYLPHTAFVAEFGLDHFDVSMQAQHALRSAVKRGEPGALAALGFGALADVVIGQSSITPQRVLLDCVVHCVKANGQSRAKVFKPKTLDLAANKTQRVGKNISLAELTTRKHYAGLHRADVFPFSPVDLSRPLHAIIPIDPGADRALHHRPACAPSL